MRSSTELVAATDGAHLYLRTWLPDQGSPRAAVLIVHGLAEHSARYAGIAEALTESGIAAYAHDHRGHGHTSGRTDLGYLPTPGGWESWLADQRTIASHVAGAHRNSPVVMLGHSLGSFIARGYAARFGSSLTALILSGTAGNPRLQGRIGALAATAQAKAQGDRRTAYLVNRMAMGSYTKSFAPSRTEFDWLSGDHAEVDAYVADPWCGFVPSAGVYAAVLDGLLQVSQRRCYADTPPQLPILLLAGEQDPVGGFGSGPQEVATEYRRAGVRDVELVLYARGRHEMLHEVDREAVIADLLRWVNTRLSDG